MSHSILWSGMGEVEMGNPLPRLANPTIPYLNIVVSKVNINLFLFTNNANILQGKRENKTDNIKISHFYANFLLYRMLTLDEFINV